MTTEYHAKLFAHELGRRHSVADASKLATTLLDAQVDLNPHQVEAALFAFSQDLVAAGADLAAVMQAGRWKTPTMPARYNEHLLAAKGAVAQYYQHRGGL
jgi:hypothetical protein